MAFITVGASPFRGAAVRGPSSLSVSARPAPKMMSSNDTALRRSAAPAFSSIDDPSTSVALVDMALETKADVLTALYRHVFGNAYVMESERAELAVAESDFKKGTINVRDMVRAMAKSAQYKKKFFERSSPYRFVELNCKHLLGRGPSGQDEVSFHVQKIINEGYDAEIDSYLDSEEYEERFGELDVPRFIYEGCYGKNDYFNRMNVMRQHWDGCSTSTKYGSTAPAKPMGSDLQMGHGDYVTGFPKIMRGLQRGRWYEPETENAYGPSAGFPKNPAAPLKVRIEVAPNLFQVFEIPGIKIPSEPEWKKDVESANPGKKWNGVFF